MEYPAVTHTLFALTVMIIVLLIILGYCCWGAFTCGRRDPLMDIENTQPSRRESQNSTAFVILPYRNMVYIGDRRTQQIFQYRLKNDKQLPPPYSEVDRYNSPPPYSSTITLPPPYEEEVINPCRVFKSQTSQQGSNKCGTSVESSQSFNVPRSLPNSLSFGFQSLSRKPRIKNISNSTKYLIKSASYNSLSASSMVPTGVTKSNSKSLTTLSCSDLYKRY